MTRTRVSDSDLQAIIRAEIASADGQSQSELSIERIQNMDYYECRPFGNELEGRSTVVSSDVRDMLSVGGAYDAQNQAVLNNQLNAWAYGQQQPWNILNAYGGAITGLGALGGTSSGTSTNSQNQSLVPSLIGSAAAFLPFL